jgi:hypothetical protein
LCIHPLWCRPWPWFGLRYRWGKREKEALSEGDGKVYKESIWSTYIRVLPEYAYNVSPFTVFSNAVYVFRECLMENITVHFSISVIPLSSCQENIHVKSGHMSTPSFQKEKIVQGSMLRVL